MLKFSHDDRNKDNDWIFEINEICISNKKQFSNVVIIYMYTSINKSHEEACVMGEITKVLNSNESLPIDENLLVTVGFIDIPKGGTKLPVNLYLVLKIVSKGKNRSSIRELVNISAL